MQPIAPEQEVDRPYLSSLLQKALQRPALEILDWKSNPLHGGVEWDSAVFRFEGQARDAGETLPWSLILKAVRCSQKASNPGGIWYWKREALAYQTGFLQRLPGGNLGAPACYEVSERPDGSLWLWLEDIRDDIGAPWPLEQYALAARQLGQFNGAYLTGLAIPSEPWIPQNWLRQYVENAAKMIEFVRSNPNHPVIMHVLPGDDVAQVLAVWEQRKTILDLLENLPQVFCHQDAFKRNLFFRQGKTIAIDWGYMGNAAVGAELVALVAASISFFEVPVERVEQLDRICFEGYLQGLRDAGWNGDPRLVRTGYVVSLLLRYPIGGTVGEMLATFLDQERRSQIETAFEHKTADELEKTDPAINAYYQARLPEAMKLLGTKRLAVLLGRIAVQTLRLRRQRRK